MPAQFVTLKKSHPDFLNHLWGGQAADFRMIPVKTYNLGTEAEAVTFEVKKTSDIKTESFLKFTYYLIKLKSFIFILIPLFYVVVKNYVDNRFFNPLSLLFASLASLFLFAGLNIRNDVNDHLSGFDRVNMNANTKPIIQGLITAKAALKWSWILIFVAFAFALPSFIMQHELILVVLVAFILFTIGQFFKNNSYKQQHFGEFVLFMLVGPSLASGYQVALGAGIDTEILAFGVLWGFAVLFLIQVNNFSHIMTSSQAGIKNTMTKLGFDLSQKFLIGSWLGFIFLWVLFHYHYGSTYWMVFGTVLLVAWSVPLFNKVLNIKSTMGSGLLTVRAAAYKTFLIMVCIFIFENFWFLWADAI